MSGFGQEAQHPLANAVVSLALKKTRNNIWIVSMKASLKPYLPGAEQFAIKLQEDLDEITD
jgi:hypothetical protein